MLLEKKGIGLKMRGSFSRVRDVGSRLFGFSQKTITASSQLEEKMWCVNPIKEVKLYGHELMSSES